MPRITGWAGGFHLGTLANSLRDGTQLLERVCAWAASRRFCAIRNVHCYVLRLPAGRLPWCARVMALK